uniref:Little elongation complex subunit 2 C-terminal domain-containing protein n=1 Tax=Mola mola TaxID=94237 RepID=A0A3Q4AK52_MOLML
KFSLSPNIRELWAFLQSKEESHNDASESDDQCADSAVEGKEDFKGGKKKRKKLSQVVNEEDAGFPEPRLPYPSMSSLSSKDIACSHILVNSEVMQFMMYLQDVAKICADDYNFISQGAMQYSEFFIGCLECINAIPQLYHIHEMTSLTGGTFNPGLTLTFEKQLISLLVLIQFPYLYPLFLQGNVDITDHMIVPADAQLASDYQSVSSVNPPAKKTISGDSNAEKLSARYEPHVCLTRDALVRLLDNHGPNFAEQWEVPVVVKINPVKGTTLYKKEILHHRYKFLCVCSYSIRSMSLHFLFLNQESSQRNLVSFENNGLDFEVDLTDLETFGDTTPMKIPKMDKMHKEQDASFEMNKATSSTFSSKTKSCSEQLKNTSSSSQEEMNSSLTVVDDVMIETATPPAVSETTPRTEQTKLEYDQEIEKEQTFTGDSDDEKLVIDDSLSPAATSAKPFKPQSTPCSGEPPLPPASGSVPLNSQLPSPQKVTQQRRQSKRAKVSGDQLSEILRMQSAMFNCPTDTAKCSTVSQDTNSPSPCMGPLAPSHQVSLVKPCVSSYLERNQNQGGETCRILSQDLQASAEDEQDYEAPQEGNLLYKLYSLQDLLIMVRSSVSLTHTRKVGSMHVLPKLEYQLSYGVECLSSSEACQLWTETLLHSSTVSYTGIVVFPDSVLEQGRYLIAHKAGEPFVTLLKEANGKVTRGAYNLQHVHSSVPRPPASSLVPWIPVDPAVVLPFHQNHGHIPCTFPVEAFAKTIKDGSSQANNQGAGQSKNRRGKTKMKKSKRAIKRNMYIKKLIQKSI